MSTKFIEIDWLKDFPPEPMVNRFKNNPQIAAKRAAKIRESAKKRKHSNWESMLPLVKPLFESGMARYKIAEKLGCAKKTVNNVLKHANIKY